MSEQRREYHVKENSYVPVTAQKMEPMIKLVNRENLKRRDST